MDINGYMSRIESSVEDAVVLEAILSDAAADAGLSPDEKDAVDGRARGYLADLAREQGDEVIEEDEDASAS